MTQPLRLTLALGFALLMGLTPVAQAPTVAESRAEGRYFVVVAHGLDATQARQALKVVDPVWKTTASLLGNRRQAAVDPKPEVHLYGTTELYVAADQRNTGGRFARNLACALWSGTAHVALQPPVSPAFLEQVGLPSQTLRLLAHEATHLARYATFASHRSHPRWFADCLAFTVSHAVLSEQGLAQPMAEEPVFAQNLLQVRTLAHDDLLAPIERILSRETETPDDSQRGQSFYELYAQHQVFGAFLQTHRRGKPWQTACNALRRLGGGSSAEVTDDLLRDRLRVDDDLEAAWHAHAASLEPRWNERVRSLVSTGAKSWRQVAFPDSDARCFRVEPAGAGPHRIDVEFEFLPAVTREARLLFGGTAETNLELAIRHPVEGSAHVQLQRREGDGATHPFGHAEIDASGRIALSLSWDTATGVVSVHQGDETLVTGKTEHPLDGTWGLAAAAGSAVAWHRVELTD